MCHFVIESGTMVLVVFITTHALIAILTLCLQIAVMGLMNFWVLCRAMITASELCVILFEVSN